MDSGGTQKDSWTSIPWSRDSLPRDSVRLCTVYFLDGEVTKGKENGCSKYRPKGGGKLSPGHGEKKRVAKIADNGWQASVCSLSKKKVMPRGGDWCMCNGIND